MAHFVFKRPETKADMSDSEKIIYLEGQLQELVRTLEHVLANIDGDNLATDIMERIKEGKA
jgi:hypothetical protein